jgi:hypothetical protein
MEPRVLIQRLLDLEGRLIKQPASELEQPKTLTSPQDKVIKSHAKSDNGQDVQNKIYPTPCDPADPVPSSTLQASPVVVAAPPKKEAAHPSRYATLLQFAAVELEGIIKK